MEAPHPRRRYRLASGTVTEGRVTMDTPRIRGVVMVVKRRAFGRVGVLMAVLLTVGLPAAGAAGHGTELTLTGATVHVQWKQGWLKPGAGVRLDGTVAAPATIAAALRPLDRPGIVTARSVFELTKPGPFAVQMHLPPRPLPGRYSLRITGTDGTTSLAPVKTTITIPAPPEGVLDRVEVGTTPNGPWLSYGNGAPPVVRGSHTELWMKFRFLYPPTGQKVLFVWKLRWHTLVGKVYKRYKNTLLTSVSSAMPLPTGHWLAILRFDGRIAKAMDVVVR
jgi:hypothetical protein